MKSEKPTPRRLRKESEKGSSYKSRDLTVGVVLLFGVLALLNWTSLTPIKTLYTTVIERNFDVLPGEIAIQAVKAFAMAVAPVAIVAILCVVLMSLIQSKGILAVEAIKVDFSRLDPMKGLKNLFSLKVVKNAAAAILYTLFVFAYVPVAWKIWNSRIFAQAKIEVATGAFAAHELTMDIMLGLLLVVVPLMLLAGLLEFWMYIREMRMDKSEVKQEHKDTEGNPEVKKHRRERAMELSAQVQADVAGSSMVLANPTHIAVGIYAHQHSDDAFWPLVSVREQGDRALAVIAFAEKVGVPVVRDIPLARSVFANSTRYHFVPPAQVDAVLRLLQWLRDVERAGAAEPDEPPEK